MDQELALAILMSGRSALLTGAAGTGKTHLLNTFIMQARDQGKKVSVTATTGLAATHLGGNTIHSWSGIGVSDHLANNFFDRLSKTRREVITKTDVLVIDEISMLHDFRLDMVDRVLRGVRENDQPFGGIQLVMSGDFFQLPPINRPGEQGGGLLLKYDDGYSYEDVISWLKKRRKVLPEDWEGGEDFKQHVMRLERCGEAVETLDNIANAQLEELGIRLSEPDHRLPKRSWEFPEGSPRQKMAKDYEERFDTVNSPEELRHVVENIDPAYSEYVRERFADTVRAVSDPQVIIDRLLNEDRYDIRTRINPLWMLRNTLQTLLPEESNDLVQKFGIEKEVEKLRRHNDDVYSQLGEEGYQQLSDDSLVAEIACRIIDDMCGDDHELYDAIMAHAAAWAYSRVHKQRFSRSCPSDHFAVFINHTDKIKFPIDLPNGEAVLRAISPDIIIFDNYMQS